MNLAHGFCRLSHQGYGLLLLAAIILLLPASLLRAGVPRGTPGEQRALDAARQMREYQALRTASREFGSAQAPPAVSLRFNDGVQTASTIFFRTKMDTLPFTGFSSYGPGDLGWHATGLSASSPGLSAWVGIDSQANYQSAYRVHSSAEVLIDLTAAVAPVRVTFAESFVTERGWDYCMVSAHAPGDTATYLRGGYGSAPSGNSFGWRIVSYDLSAFAGQQMILAFEFDTGDEKFNTFPGWFVDDILVYDHAGTIKGRKFFDVNNNGVKDTGERGIRDWLITADFGAVTMTTRTDERGRYTLPLPLGDYTVSEALQPGWTQTYPPAGTWSVSMTTPDTLVDSLHFGNFTQASFINGKIFADLDQDGIFNNSDTTLPNWLVLMEDSMGNTVNFDRSDSLGEYSLFVLAPGPYIISESSPSGWTQTTPVSGSYEITIPDLVTVSGGNDFGNHYTPPSPTTSSIAGRKFNDRNRNGVWDDGEPAVPGFTIQLKLSISTIAARTTDSAGYYEFPNLPAGAYTVGEVQQTGWWRSVPESTYALLLAEGTHVDTVNFGNYELVPGSISGVKYNDLNGNGARDSGEAGMAGWRIELSGDATGTAFTDADGLYRFSGLFPGSYDVAEVWRNAWHQTSPPNLGMHHVALGPEQDFTGADFGDVQDSSFSATFRTFTYDSLALAKDALGKIKPTLRKPNAVAFRYKLLWPGDQEGTGNAILRLRFPFPTSGKVWGVRCESNTLVTYDSLFSWQNVKEVLASIPAGKAGTPWCPDPTHLYVEGIGVKGKPMTLKYRWTYALTSAVTFGALPGAPQFDDSIERMQLLLPMPSAVNLLQETAAGLKVGLGGPHSVVHPSYKEVLKSLAVKPDRLHLGEPRCLDKFAGPVPKSIKKQQKYLTPTRHNNVLLGEAVALQANIRGSDLQRTPAGFGNLIYDEGTGGAMPLNNMSVREIAATLDAFMSSYNDSLVSPACTMPAPWTGLEIDTLYDRIRKINAAFSGPVDTVSFGAALVFTGVRGVDGTSLLRYDTSSAMRPGTYYTMPALSAVPERLELYQNYPNPFNPTTTIEFFLPATSRVTLKVYNMLGQEVAAVYDRLEMEDGYQDAEFDASSLGSGVYFYRLTAEGMPDEETGAAGQTLHEVRKMLLVK